MPRLRSRSNRLAEILDASDRPLYVLNEQRCIVFCNTACADWLGRPLEEIVGVRCDFDAGESGGPGKDLSAALCPPPQVFAGEPASAWVSFHAPGGQRHRRRGEFLPLGGASESGCGAIALLSPCDEPEGPLPPVAPGDLTAQDLHDRLRELSREVRRRYRPDRLAGDSPAIHRVREQVRIAAASPTRVLIVGPPGSGREHVARTIHGGADPDTAAPLMPLSCPSLDAELLHTTVHAFLRRCAASEDTALSTLLLLDADRLAAEAQAELLAILRVASVPLRTIATSRQPLLALANEGQFSKELAYRLSTLLIELPALAERRQDIPFLAQQLVEEFNARGGAQLSGFTPETLDQLAALPWPGNVDALADVVEQACRKAAGPWITPADLPDHLQLMASAAAHPLRVEETIVLDEFLAQVERELLQRALRRARGNKARAARMLGIPRARLLRRLSQAGLDQGN